jgi:tRNA A37 threonylcarbamoyladenosine dehydratase
VHVGLWRKDEGEHLLDGADWVVDAIDNIDTKVDLLTYCRKNEISVFSSMGSGAKMDPTRVMIAYVPVDPVG